MAFGRIGKVPGIRTALRRLAEWRVEEKLGEIMPHVGASDRVLDIGSGNGVLCDTLRARGHEVEPLDVSDESLVPGVRPTVYDGERMPYADDAFDLALLITVLHHIPNPERVLAEARRVAKRMIVIEEIYRTDFERLTTYAIDSVFNFEFFGHPHTNKTDSGWRDAFRDLALDVELARHSRSLGILRRVTYVLTRREISGTHPVESAPTPTR